MNDRAMEPRLVIELTLVRNGHIMLGRIAQDGAWVLPAGSLGAGDSLTSAAQAIARSVVGGEPTELAFQRLACQAGEPGEPNRIVIGFYAELGPDSAVLDAERWLFFPLAAMPEPIGPDVELALRASRTRERVIDVGGVPLAVVRMFESGLPEARPPQASPEAEFAAKLRERPASPGRALVAAAAWIAGGVAWVAGVVAAMHDAGWLGKSAGLIAGFGVLGVFILALYAARSGVTNLLGRIAWGIGATMLSLVFGAVVCGLAIWWGGVDDARIEFWLWFLALPMIGFGRLILRRPRDRTRSRRVVGIIWVLALALSFVTVFVPLREALFRAGPSQGGATDSRPPTDD
jgi:ADP-ribose pyrophosphatase YjhB (NUDIX family)